MICGDQVFSLAFLSAPQPGSLSRFVSPLCTNALSTPQGSTRGDACSIRPIPWLLSSSHCVAYNVGPGGYGSLESG